MGSGIRDGNLFPPGMGTDACSVPGPVQALGSQILIIIANVD